MPPNLCPPERAIGISRQERDGVRKISLPSQENLEWRLLRRDDGASFGVVADALTTGEPRLSRRRRARVDGRVGNCAIEIQHIRSHVCDVTPDYASKHLHAEAVAILLLFGNQPCSFANDARWSSNEGLSQRIAQAEQDSGDDGGSANQNEVGKIGWYRHSSLLLNESPLRIRPWGSASSFN